MLCEYILAVALVWLAQRWWVMRRQRALASQLHSGLRTAPLLGHAYHFLGTDHDRMKAIQDVGRDALQMGGISKCMMLDHLLVCVADPAVAAEVLTEYLEKHQVMKVIDVVIGNSSLIAPVAIWRSRRKRVQPMFNTKNLNQFVQLYSEHATMMTELLKKEEEKRTFAFWDYISMYSLNNACMTTLNVRMDEESAGKFKSALKELLQVAAYMIVHPWVRFKLIQHFVPSISICYEHRNTLWNFVTQIIRDRQRTVNIRKHPEEGRKVAKMPSFLDTQLEAPVHQKLSDEELHEESLTLMIGGYDTSATTVGFTVLMLSRYPHVQDKVYHELQEVFGDCDRPVSPEDLSKLKYLDAVIRETLRLYPITPVVVRHAHRDLALQSGVTLVKGCGILINIWALHRNPQYWGEDADTFRPERFLDTTLRHPAAFMAFGYGPRNCFGYRYAMLSMKTVLATLVRRYRVLPPEGAGREGAVPGAGQWEPTTSYNMMLRDVDNYQIRIQRRN